MRYKNPFYNCQWPDGDLCREFVGTEPYWISTPSGSGELLAVCRVHLKRYQAIKIFDAYLEQLQEDMTREPASSLA